MRISVWQRLDVFARGLAPTFVTLLLLILSLLPTRLPGFSVVAPALTLMSVYYWAIHRPDLLPIWAAFSFGLLQDLLTGAPPGSYATVMLLAYGLVITQRRFFHGKSFPVVWWGFMMIAAGSSLVHWSLLSVLGGGVMDPWPVIFSYFMSVAVYPLITWIFVRVHRTLPGQV